MLEERQIQSALGAEEIRIPYSASKLHKGVNFYSEFSEQWLDKQL